MSLVTIATTYDDGEEFLRIDQDEETRVYVLFHRGVEIARNEDMDDFDYSEFRPSPAPSGPSIEDLAQQLTAMQSAVDDLIMTSLLG